MTDFKATIPRTLASTLGANAYSYEKLSSSYVAAWAALKILPSREAELATLCKKIQTFQDRYETASIMCDGIPWWFFTGCHYREDEDDLTSGRFACYIGNGQPLDRKTTEVPAGRGPFDNPDAFEKGCLDAMKLQGYASGNVDWSLPRSAWRWEGFNGFGYRAHGVNSPYLFGGSNLYGPPGAKGGLYTADDEFSTIVDDKRFGAITILKGLMVLNPKLIVPIQSSPSPTPEPDDFLALGMTGVQQWLNTNEQAGLVVDGTLGPATMKALSSFQKENSLPSTGLPDPATIKVMEGMTAHNVPKPLAPTVTASATTSVTTTPPPTKNLLQDVENLFASIFNVSK